MRSFLCYNRSHMLFIRTVSFLIIGIITVGTPFASLFASTTDIISVDSSEVQGNDASSAGTITPDGRYIVFQSEATNLVAGDTNGVSDIFLHDTQSGDTTRVSVDSNGGEGNNESAFPSISSDGRYITFQSDATDLVTGDTNAVRDIFLHDTQTGDTTRVSVDSNGVQGNALSYTAKISDDGRYIVFNSYATNLVVGDTNGRLDIFLHDTQTGDTTRVSVDSNGVEGNGESTFPALSSDGQFIVFQSEATNLVVGDTNAVIDIFLHDTQTGDTTRVSVDSNGNESNNESYAYVNISSTGRYIVYESQASNLVVGDTNSSYDIFIHDTQIAETIRVSVDSLGIEGNNDSYKPSISSDGRFVVFHSDATNLITSDTNGDTDVFLYDTETRTTTEIRTVRTSGRSRAILYRLNQSGMQSADSCLFFNEYLTLNDRDTSQGGEKSEVAKLQQFLMEQGFSIVRFIDGIFGPLTRDALIAWQNHYAEEVLSPWASSGVTTGTGNFFATSRRWANMQKGCTETVTLRNGITLPDDSSHTQVFY